MTDTAVKHASAPARRRINYLPYLLSLPALLVCIGILIPFVTAVYYSLQRYRLNLPAMRGFIWFQNYVNFFTDSEFWHTVQVSLEYTVLTVGVELLFGLGIAMLLQKRTRVNPALGLTKMKASRATDAPPRACGLDRSGAPLVKSAKAGARLSTVTVTDCWAESAGDPLSVATTVKV